MTTTLEEVLADAKKTVETVERVGSTFSPAAVRDVVTAIERAAEDYLTWLPESTAMIRANRSRRWLRAQYPAWLDQGHARMVNGERQYRALIVPRGANQSAAYEAGQRAARGEAA
jgi:hypothetical protein